jgi:hypothetical protein
MRDLIRRKAATGLLALALVSTTQTARAEESTDASSAGKKTAAGVPGYWLAGVDGGVFAFGDAPFHGSAGGLQLNQPIVGIAPTPAGSGYWMVATDGGIFAYGDARFFGSTGDVKLNQPIVGMTSTDTGNGYWMVASDGGIFTFGDAAFRGSTGDIALNRPIVGMTTTPSGQGYWMVASDGGIFTFGDARFFGSTGDVKLNKPITGMAATRTGKGYWLVASDGGVFTFGDAVFYGSAPEQAAARGSSPPRRVVSIVPTHTGAGYWQVTASGEVLAFGDAPNLGSPSAVEREVVGMAANPVQAAAAPEPAPTSPEPAPAPTTPANGPTLGPPQFFSSIPNPTWGTGPSTTEDKKAARVYSLAEAGDLVYIAGEFETMVPPGKNPGPGIARRYLAAVNRHTGELTTWDAGPNDVVLSLATSPDGKILYVGGRFSSIGGAPAGRLAALDALTGQQIASFRAPGVDAGVRTMTLHAPSNTLYIGGPFENVGEVARDQLAALDATTGALKTDWVGPDQGNICYTGQTGSETDGCKGFPMDMAVTEDGSLLYVGGSFADFGGEDHGGLVTLDAATGEMTDWQVENDRPIHGLTVWPGDGKSLVVATGGTGGQVQFYQWKSSKRDSEPEWIHKVDGDATDVAATRERVYLVGHYDFVLGDNTTCGTPPCRGSEEAGDQPNRHLSVFDAKDGAHDLSFTAQANTPQGPYVAFIGRDHYYVGGDFTNIDVRAGGQEYVQPGFVQFPAVEPRG